VFSLIFADGDVSAKGAVIELCFLYSEVVPQIWTGG